MPQTYCTSTRENVAKVTHLFLKREKKRKNVNLFKENRCFFCRFASLKCLFLQNYTIELAIRQLKIEPPDIRILYFAPFEKLCSKAILASYKISSYPNTCGALIDFQHHSAFLFGIKEIGRLSIVVF